MARRLRFIVVFGVVAMLVFATGISAGAAPGDNVATTKYDVSAAQERLKEIRMEAGTAHEEYNNALFKMNELNEEIADAQKDLDASEEDLKEAQASLEERAAQIYKSGNVAFIDVLVGVDDFSEFAARLDLWMRLLEQERAAYESVLAAKEDLEEHKSELETERARRVEAVEEALDQKKQASESESEAEDYLNSLNADLQGAIQAEQERSPARLPSRPSRKGRPKRPLIRPL
jgi:peptidoglycan hydrolase CwlO-like protein